MNRSTQPRGFTLIEMLVVMAVITILAGILVPTIISAREKVKIAKAKMDMQNLQGAADTFRMDWRVYPPHNARDLRYFVKQVNSGICEEAAEKAIEIADPKESADKKKLYDTNRILVHFLTTELKGGPYMQFKSVDLEKNGKFSDYVLDCRTTTTGGTGGATAYLFIDPWGKPYIYRNNLDSLMSPSDQNWVADPIECAHNVKGIDLFCTGPEGTTALDEPNYLPGEDDCKNGEVGDDINNWAKKE